MELLIRKYTYMYWLPALCIYGSLAVRRGVVLAHGHARIDVSWNCCSLLAAALVATRVRVWYYHDHLWHTHPYLPSLGNAGAARSAAAGALLARLPTVQ